MKRRERYEMSEMIADMYDETMNDMIKECDNDESKRSRVATCVALL